MSRLGRARTSRRESMKPTDKYDVRFLYCYKTLRRLGLSGARTPQKTFARLNGVMPRFHPGKEFKRTVGTISFNKKNKNNSFSKKTETPVRESPSLLSGQKCTVFVF